MLVCYGCRKVPQAGGLKQQKLISSQFWKLDVQDQGFGRIDFILRLLPWLVDDHLLLLVLSCVRPNLRFIRTPVVLDQGPPIGPLLP